MLRELKKNDAGMVMVTALALSIIMAVLAMGVLSMNVSQVNMGENQVKRIKAQQLALGAWAVAYSNVTQGGSVTDLVLSESLDGKTYSASVSPSTPNSGPNVTDPYLLNISY